MAEATLSAPLTLDPRQAVRLRVRSTRVDHVGHKIGVTVEYLDAGGNVIHTESDQIEGTQVTTWIDAQETPLLNRWLAKKSLTGTVG